VRTHYSDNMVQVYEGAKDTGGKVSAHTEAPLCYSYKSSRVTCRTPAVQIDKAHFLFALLEVGLSL
jgi:hypothetical protein